MVRRFSEEDSMSERKWVPVREEHGPWAQGNYPWRAVTAELPEGVPVEKAMGLKVWKECRIAGEIAGEAAGTFGEKVAQVFRRECAANANPEAWDMVALAGEWMRACKVDGVWHIDSTFAFVPRGAKS